MTQTAKPLSIVHREQEQNTITYGILSGEITYIATLENGAPCGCVSDNGSACASYYYSKGEKTCKHCKLAQQNEQERSSDLKQHLQDGPIIHTCVACSNRVKVANTYCFGCLA
jgi:hypothetical protein